MKRERIESVSRALTVIQVLAEEGRSSLKDLNAGTGLSNAALIRILNTLEEHGWVRRLLAESKFELTFCFSSVVGAKPHGHPLAELVAPYLKELAEQVPWPSDIATCTKFGKIKILESTRTRVLMPMNELYGLQPSMARSAMGLAYLASCSGDECAAHVEKILKNNDKRDRYWIESGRLETELQKTRERGYAMRDSDYWVGSDGHGPEAMAIGIPIVDGDRVFASMNLVWLAKVSSVEEIAEKYLPMLNETARQIGADIAADKPLADTFDFSRRLSDDSLI